MTLKPLRVLALHVANRANLTLSYQLGYPAALASSPLFRAKLINLDAFRHSDLLKLRLYLLSPRIDAVILFHSVFSNANFISSQIAELLSRCRAPKIFFLANEYKLMPEKIDLARKLGASLVISQTNDKRVHDLYRSALRNCHIGFLPNSGVDPKIFFPLGERRYRPIDVGYRAADVPWYFGHRDRHNLCTYFSRATAERRLSSDISLEADARLPLLEWAAFLNRCKCQLGSEAGHDYFELTDETRLKVNTYLRENPDVGFDEIHTLFFANYPDPVPMRIISSRIIEAAACKATQILIEGSYDGYLEPDVHYIPLKSDFSNVDECLDKLLDEQFADQLANRAYEAVMHQLTFDSLLRSLHAQISQLL